MDFTFFCPTKIIFGSGSLKNVGNSAAALGDKALIVCGRKEQEKLRNLNLLQEKLHENSVQTFLFKRRGKEPIIEDVDEGVEYAIKVNASIVISLGGGSSIDLGKAISGIVTNGGTAMDYIEGIGYGKMMDKPSLPFIAIPTTAGTGSEVTKNAVITSERHKVKKSIRSECLYPDYALIDPELTITLPPEVTAFSGMDALTQLIEAYVSKKSQPVTSALALYGIKLAGRSLEKVFKNGSDLSHRENMSLAGMLSGIALANAGLGAVHGLSASMGALYNVPHGLICGILLPGIMALNKKYALKDYSEIGEALSGERFQSMEEGAEAGIQFIRRLKKELKIDDTISKFGVAREDIPKIIHSASSSSMSGNPGELSETELEKMMVELL